MIDLAMYGVVLDEDAEVIAPAEPIPELPAEVWNDSPVDTDRAHAATVALCRGN